MYTPICVLKRITVAFSFNNIIRRGMHVYMVGEVYPDFSISPAHIISASLEARH